MKALRRGDAPAALSRYRHGRDTWDDLTAEDRHGIWTALDAMQGGLCAYCEGSLDELGRHVEHFFPRGRRPQGTFDWDNLFGSCLREDSCGRYKDGRRAPSYEHGDLLDPARDDPDRFLIIRFNGHIDVRPGLSDPDIRRADLTLRVFNLNLDENKGGRSLCAIRARVLEFYLQREPDVLEALEDFPKTDRAPFIDGEIAAAATTPFGSIIRHFFHAA